MERLSSARRAVLAGLVLAGLGAGTAAAHHGWSWVSAEPFILTGTIQEICIGHPHVTMEILAEDGAWHVDLAPPRADA